jgi:mono/diheme cytochrome c family protein
MSPQASTALLTATLALVAATAAIAAPSADVAAGRKVALRACGGCHAVDRGDSPQSGAPPFRLLYRRLDVADLPSRFQDGMMASHSRMPVVRLDAAEVAFITAYLQTLQPKPKATV